MIKSKLSALVKNQFPDFYKEDGKNFLAFVEAYYEYLEQNGKLTDAIQNIQDYKNIDTTLEEYIDYFQDTLLPSVPHNVLADKKLMAKYVTNFNIARGTEASYKLLFRSIYNEDVELKYPSDQMLKLSDGDWRLDRYLVTLYDTKVYDLIGKTIEGKMSGARALVEDVKGRIVRNRDVMQILVSKNLGVFRDGEQIRVYGQEDTLSTFSPVIEAGINKISIINAGGEYKQGDVVELLSDNNGSLGKVVVTDTVDLGGSLTFQLNKGGSGYTSTTYGDDQGESQIVITGGDGLSPASFTLETSDIGDTFAIYMNTDLIGSRNQFGDNAPTVSYPQSQWASAQNGIMNTFANNLISSPNYGFPRGTSIEHDGDFWTNEGAVLSVANTDSIVAGNRLYGGTSGAVANVTSVPVTTAGSLKLIVNSYKDFSSAESLSLSPGGASVGSVSGFSANAVGRHIVEFGVKAGQNIAEGDEVVSFDTYDDTGRHSFGVVKKVVSTTTNGYLSTLDLVRAVVAANTTSSITNQFDSGPLIPFREQAGVRKVGSTTHVANVATAAYSSNTVVEHVFTKLEDSLHFKNTTFGTIESLSNRVGGSGFSVAPTVTVTEPNISVLGIGEQYVTIETSASLTATTDANDRLEQGSAGGDIKNVQESTLVGDKYHTVIRVWQDFLQREPGNISFANNVFAVLKHYNGSYIPGSPDTRSYVSAETVKIVNIDDRGVLGKNADIDVQVGADGTVSNFRIIDSGFSYTDGERVRVKESGRENSTQAVVDVSLAGTANSEGYYATSRSHVSTKRGYIQDSNYYQEYSYEVISAIDLNKYKSVAMKLVHTAGQTMFGKYQMHSNVHIEITTDGKSTKRLQSAGLVSLAQGSTDILTDGNTTFTDHFADNGTMIIEISEGEYISVPLNIVTSNTQANTKVAWTGSSISNAKIYYTTGNVN